MMTIRKITEVNLVAYLKCKGFQEAEPPKVTGPFVTFYLEDSPELKKEIETYFSQKGLVEPMAMVESLRLIKSKVGDMKRNRESRFGGGQDE
jgi:hypothetical protein